VQIHGFQEEGNKQAGKLKVDENEI